MRAAIPCIDFCTRSGLGPPSDDPSEPRRLKEPPDEMDPSGVGVDSLPISQLLVRTANVSFSSPVRTSSMGLRCCSAEGSVSPSGTAHEGAALLPSLSGW
eukprot:CAMPEP_0206216180 /NCGR_PEP_ID=MMETSP0047_2-20121206/2585_1 /ASSEMBLY_ACC=CAM_ASM_000192 /TAXON_ID=195065 /ORGANISM="Chroomonas mesostigmatica_cf, Strain CCMP1168" /LENGTH=99 /DNA_ID=CAMNT_0053638513 /DNA_START=1 /DNA_END=297 /DNA_ORIENTATION=+